MKRKFIPGISIWKTIAIGIVAWVIMLPLLLLNYIIFGYPIEYFFTGPIFYMTLFGAITVLFPLIYSLIFKKFKIFQAIISGISRWFLIWTLVLMTGETIDYYFLMFFVELLIMIFSYVIAALITNYLWREKYIK